MFRTTSIVLALVLLPAVADAQGRGRDRGARDNSEELSRSMPTGPTLSSRDVEKSSPLKYFIDKRKDLKLSDDQLKQVKDMDAQQKDKNAASYKTVDSLVRVMKPTTSVQTAEDEARVIIAREALMQVLSDVRTSDGAAADAAMAGFDDAQKATAAELLKKQREDVQSMMRSKMGGGRGGPPGGRPGS